MHLSTINEKLGNLNNIIIKLTQQIDDPCVRPNLRQELEDKRSFYEDEYWLLLEQKNVILDGENTEYSSNN